MRKERKCDKYCIQIHDDYIYKANLINYSQMKMYIVFFVLIHFQFNVYNPEGSISPLALSFDCISTASVVHYQYSSLHLILI